VPEFVDVVVLGLALTVFASGFLVVRGFSRA
jgi:hypothetical protein